MEKNVMQNTKNTLNAIKYNRKELVSHSTFT